MRALVLALCQYLRSKLLSYLCVLGKQQQDHIFANFIPDIRLSSMKQRPGQSVCFANWYHTYRDLTHLCVVTSP